MLPNILAPHQKWLLSDLKINYQTISREPQGFYHYICLSSFCLYQKYCNQNLQWLHISPPDIVRNIISDFSKCFRCIPCVTLWTWSYRCKKYNYLICSLTIFQLLVKLILFALPILYNFFIKSQNWWDNQEKEVRLPSLWF